MPKRTDIRKILQIGSAFLGEPLSTTQAAGALLVGSGIYLVNTRGA